MASENWRPVPGWDGLYEVSDQGRVQSLRRAKCRGGLLRPLRHTGGYARIMLWREGLPRQTFIHRLVALAFLGAPEPGMQVAHNNGDRQDNRATNLRWATPSENQADRERHGTGRVGRPRKRGIPHMGLAEAGRVRAVCAQLGGNKTAAARALGMSRTTVADIVNGRTWPETFLL